MGDIETNDNSTVNNASLSSGNEVQSADDTFDDTYHDTENYSENDNSSVGVVVPQPGGTLSYGDSYGLIDNGTYTEDDSDIGEQNSATNQPTGDYETDTSDVTDNDGGTATYSDYLNLNTTDPTTGLLTNVQLSDNDTDTFVDHFTNDISFSGRGQRGHST